MAWFTFSAMLLPGPRPFLLSVFFFFFIFGSFFLAHVSYGVATMASIEFTFFSLCKIIQLVGSTSRLLQFVHCLVRSN
jgi:hypothetical protein